MCLNNVSFIFSQSDILKAILLIIALYERKIIAVKDTTFAVVKRRPKKIQAL